MLTELQPFFGQLHCMSYIALLSVNTQTQAQSFFHPFLIRIVHLLPYTYDPLNHTEVWTVHE